MAHLLNGFRDLQGTSRSAPDGDAQVLLQENDELRKMLGDYESRLAEALSAKVPEASRTRQT